MELVVIAHNVRSTYNVGSIFRTCEGFGVKRLCLTGYTPYPVLADDMRPPHIRKKIAAQINKTALGAEQHLPFTYRGNATSLLNEYRELGYTIAALEQTATSVLLPGFMPPEKLVLLLGEEVKGITLNLLALCDVALEIPMRGHKESFNVSVATGVALYALYYAKSP